MRKNLLFFLVIFMFNPLLGQQKVHTLASLTRSSDAIVEGSVTSIKYYEKEPGRIYSEINIKITKSIKGILSEDQIITLEHLGGTMGSIRQIVPQLPQFVENENSILFLKTYYSKNNPMGFYDLLGSSQGKFNIINDNHKNQKIIRDKLVVEYLLLESSKQNLGINNSMSLSLDSFMFYLSSYLSN